MDNINHAQFANASYALNSSKKKEDRFRQAEALVPKNYELHEKSNRDVAMFVNGDKKHAIIAHRGSDFKKKRDIGADIKFALGLQAHSKEYQKRAGMTERMVKDIPGDFKIDLTGHSYGGASALHSAIVRPKLRQRLNKIHIYNPATQMPKQKPKLYRKEKAPDVERDLHEKTTVHRTQGDVPSVVGTDYGTVETHDVKDGRFKSAVMPELAKPAFQTLDQLKTHSIENFI